MTNKNYFSDYLQDKTAASGKNNKDTTFSCMSVMRGKIDRYRKKQDENAKKEEKTNEAKLKEIQKQQAEIQQPQTVADKMRDNFNQFAGSNFAGNSPTAIPTVSAPTPIGAQQKQAAFYKKIACLVNEINSIYKYATGTNDDIANNANVNPGVRKSIAGDIINSAQEFAKSGWLPKQLNDWGPLVLALTGMQRNDNRKNLDIRTVNVHNKPNNQLGNVDSFLRGVKAKEGYITRGVHRGWRGLHRA